MSFAAITEHDPFEVVLEHSVALAVLAAEGDHLLHSVEKYLIDDRFVSSGVDLAFVGDAPHVVHIS